MTTAKQDTHGALLAEWHKWPRKWRECPDCKAQFFSPVVPELLLHIAMRKIERLQRTQGDAHADQG